MSADNAIYVQQNKEGKIVAQHGFASADELPNPEEALSSEIFETLEEAILATKDDALFTEYGFQIHLPSPNEHGVEVVDLG